uniref:Uncharacterized protein n=1 Tax=Anguilla anguilla TaxID=7936 RepID=A0A0E9QTD4_ANGAN
MANCLQSQTCSCRNPTAVSGACIQSRLSSKTHANAALT